MGQKSVASAISGSLLLDDADLVIQAALDGTGLVWVTEDRVAEHLESGAPIRVLEDWCPPFPGFFLYYPGRRQQPSALSALIATRRVWRDSRHRAT
jgi:DNA-binding transcriptional LysR family regulator